MKQNNSYEKTSGRGFLHKRLLSLISYLIIFITLGYNASPVFSQWKKIAQFPSEINTVFFKDFSNIPQDGFVSLVAGGPSLQKLWRTLDGGTSWTLITLPPNFFGIGTVPMNFSFKNSLEGWFADFEGNDIFNTTDGGSTWVQSVKNINIVSVFYAPLTNKLLLAGALSTIGIAFSDSVHGIMSGIANTNLIYTTDAGISWQQSNQLGEQFQPIGIQGTRTFFILTEQNSFDQEGSLLRSDDGGMNWRKIYQYHDHTNLQGVTGTLQYNSRAVFFQTIPDNSEGIMMSPDSGVTFVSICGPPSGIDTRFYVRDSFIYAGDKFGGLWLNTTGIGSNSTPQLSITNRLSLTSTVCKPIDSAIIVTFFDSCNGNQAQLVNASISGSGNFSLIAPFNAARIIHQGDSIIVHYDPVGSFFDSAQLSIRFRLGWKDFDTTISLRGSGIPHPKSHFSLTQLTFPGTCTAPDSLISFSCFDSCSGIPATLDSISLQGSGNFSIIAPVNFPRTVHPNDSLFISYDPQSQNKDTTKLILYFQLGDQLFDTTIYLFGAGRIPKENIQFTPALTNSSASPGMLTNLYVMPDKAISSRGLQSISFDLNYIGDLLDLTSFLNNITSGIPGATITPGIRTHSGRMETLPVTITGSDLSLDPKLPIIDVKYKVMLTDTTSTPITMTNVKLNGGDQNYANCVLSVDSSNTNFTLLFLCGDSTLYKFMRGENAVEITSIHPNPSQDEIEVDLQSTATQDATIEIFDALGAKVFSDTRNIIAGSNSVHLDTKNLSGGMYLVRIGGVSQCFLKIK